MGASSPRTFRRLAASVGCPIRVSSGVGARPSAWNFVILALLAAELLWPCWHSGCRGLDRRKATRDLYDAVDRRNNWANRSLCLPSVCPPAVKVIPAQASRLMTSGKLHEPVCQPHQLARYFPELQLCTVGSRRFRTPTAKSVQTQFRCPNWLLLLPPPMLFPSPSKLCSKSHRCRAELRARSTSRGAVAVYLVHVSFPRRPGLISHIGDAQPRSWIRSTPGHDSRLVARSLVVIDNY